jgi:hypothetical protein
MVKFSTNTANTNFIVKVTCIGQGLGASCEIFVASCDLMSNNETAFIINLNGTLPSTIGIYDFTFNWEATALPVNAPYCPVACTPVQTDHSYYVLLANPRAPMAEPWHRVLEKSCEWAYGIDDEMEAIEALTSYLYHESGLEYNTEFYSHYYSDPPAPFATKRIFDLTNLLDQWTTVDCQDCSIFLTILSGSLGAPLVKTRRITGPFLTKSIDLIGENLSWQENVYWYFHQVAWLDNVYDPTIMLKHYLSPDYLPINVDIDNPYKTDLKKYVNDPWLPYEPFIIGNTDPFYNLPSIIE